MNYLRFLAISSLLTAVAANISTVHAQTAYALNNNGRTLIRFELASPSTFTTIGDFTGLVTEVDGIDFRVSNGLLYGYNQEGNALFTINTANAFTAFAVNPSAQSTSESLGIDFNPQVVQIPGVLEDRLRLVNANNENLRINMATGGTITDGSLTYAAGDSGFGLDPGIDDAAYTNNDNDINTTTQLYYLDSARDVLATTANPNSGSITTVGSGLGVDTTVGNGFDIYSFNGANTGYALLSTGASSTALYSISLTGGGATRIGSLTGDNPTNLVYGLAVAPTVVPETGTVCLLAAALAVGLPFLRRRRA